MSAPPATRPWYGRSAPDEPLGPEGALRRCAYLLERSLAPTSKVQAYRRAADVVAGLEPGELDERLAGGRLQELAGIGPSTAAVITQAAAGRIPDRQADLERDTTLEAPPEAWPWLDALRWDGHLHSDWSDGGAPIEEMALAARALGHDFVVLTDHSARLTIAHGLDRDRLLAQLDEIEALNGRLAPFRVLSGMEVDIFDDGSLDLDDDLLARLDLVVASAHRSLRMDARAMTERLVLAVANPHVDVLGHCTGRKLSALPPTAGRPTGGSTAGDPPASDPEPLRPPSTFDAEIVFAACARFETAVELNCRPERQDPPDELLDLAIEWGCHLAVHTDAHACGQLEWQTLGATRLAQRSVEPSQVITTWDASTLADWAGSHPET